MANSWDDMRKAKEESYFDRKNREALERLAQKQSTQAALISPVSGQPMVQEVLHGVVIDRCPVSGGIWLDNGELEQLMKTAVEEAANPKSGSSVASFLKDLAGIKK